MSAVFRFFLLLALGSWALAGQLMGMESRESVEATPVPEPSILILGGLFGVFFLFWRKK